MSKYVALLIEDNYLAQQFSISLKFVLLYLDLIFSYQFEDHVVLFQMILPLVLITEKLPKELRVVNKAHNITDLVEVVLPLKNFDPLLVFLCSSFALLKHLVASLLCLLTLLFLFGYLVFLLLDEVLPALLCGFFLHVSVVMLPLILLHDLVPTLLGLTHLVVDIEFHIIHCHLHDVVCLVNFFDLLLGLVTKDLNLGFTTFLSFSQFVIEGTFSLVQQLLPFLFSDLLAIADLLIPLFLRVLNLGSDFLCFFL